MEKDNSNSFNSNHSLQEEQDSNKSFVRKVRSRMSEFIPSSLSKWFGSDNNREAVVRPREDDDESYGMQPPLKRFKRPSPVTELNHVQPDTSTVTVDTSSLYSRIANDAQSRAANVFLEPIAGPSGIKSRKTFATSEINCNTEAEIIRSQDDKDSDSGESTSGYSSMARISHKGAVSLGDQKKADVTLNNTNAHNLFNSPHIGHTRSLFTERSLSPQLNSSLSSRRPSFNASTFGSQSFLDRTLTTKRIISSPFYSGRTTYGGASAYNYQKRVKDREALKKQIQVRPVVNSTANDSTTLSKTARRILNTLDQYTSPLTDAEKIPTPAKKSRTEGLLLKYTCANPYSIRDYKVASTASNKELLVPTVPQMLKMKLKEKLQESTESVRKLATTSNLALSNDHYSIRTVEDKSSKHTNKLKNKISSVRQKPQNEVVEEVKLPDIALPITTLPKFDFTLPLPPSSTKPLVTVALNDPVKSTPLPTSETCSIKAPKDISKTPSIVSAVESEYKFSNPEVLAENLIAITAINDFKFSNPVIKLIEKSSTSLAPIVNFKAAEVLDNFKSFDQTSLKLKKKETSVAQPIPTLINDTVDNAFGSSNKSPLHSLNKFKPASGSWECTSCLIRNLPDKTKCAACAAPKTHSDVAAVKQTTNVPKTTGFGEQFKLSSDKWECTVCMVRNNKSDLKCVSCTTPKPCSEKSEKAVNNTFGNKFKPPSDTWECPTCMVRNKDDIGKCIACETLKPGSKIQPNGFGSKFQVPSGTWECPTCMIRNKNDVEKCLACETLKPGSKPLPPNGFGNRFTKKTNEWECSVCMVRNSSDKPKCVACETPNPKATSTNGRVEKEKPPASLFTFGIVPDASSSIRGLNKPPEQSEVKTSVPLASVFGSNKPTAATSSTSTPSFSFGIPTNPSASENKSKTSVAEAGTKSPKSSFEKLPKVTTFGKVDVSAEIVTEKPKSISDTSATKLGETPPSASKLMFGSSPLPVKQPQVTQPKSNLVADTPVTKPEFNFNSTAPTLKRSPINFDQQSASSRKRSLTSDMQPQPASSFTPPTKFEANKSQPNSLFKAKSSSGFEPQTKINSNIFGVSSTPSTVASSAPNSFGFPANQPQSTTASTTANSSFGFSGNPVQSTAISTTTNTFGFTTASSQSSVLPTTTANSNLFTFGASKSSPGFGTANSTDEAPFKFGGPSKSKSTFEINTSAQPAVQNNVFTSTSTPSSMFTTPNKSVFEVPKQSVFEAPSGAPSIFETPTKSIFKPMKPLFEQVNKPLFQTPSKTGFDPPSKSMFDMPNKPVFEAPAVTSPPAFGAASGGFGPSSSEVKPFSFGGSSGDNLPPSKAPPAYPFGQPTTKPNEAPKPPVFSFGNTAAPANPASGGFNFGGNNNSNSNNNYNFNSSKIENPAPFHAPVPASNMFGTSTQMQAPAQPVQNGGFNFGSAAASNTGKTGFNFGNAPAAPQFNAQPAASSGVFSFGASNQNPPAQSSSGGFNFGSPAAAPAPAFNANMQPTFNFTGGATPIFSAQPAGGDASAAALQQRKKIRAIRRTQR